MRLNAGRGILRMARLLSNRLLHISPSRFSLFKNRHLSSTPFRYDPNELSVEGDSEGTQSAIKSLNFSRACVAEDNAVRSFQEDCPSPPLWSGENAFSSGNRVVIHHKYS